MAWKELLRVEYGEKYVYIYIDIDTALVIPVRSVTSGDLEKFAERVRVIFIRKYTWKIMESRLDRLYSDLCDY